MIRLFSNRYSPALLTLSAFTALLCGYVLRSDLPLPDKILLFVVGFVLVFTIPIFKNASEKMELRK